MDDFRLYHKCPQTPIANVKEVSGRNPLQDVYLKGKFLFTGFGLIANETVKALEDSRPKDKDRKHYHHE